ncbi:MAG TPA: DUF1592 domain-containing protein [Bdellovibrionota bacterium]|nr:DUF1592 domain-containing protein [Bdellovibrionota bacterium]
MIRSSVLLIAALLASTARADREYDEIVRPFLARSCFSCHGNQTRAGGIDLEKLPASDLTGDQAKTWASVLESIRAGRMPPARFPFPSGAEVAALSSWIERRESSSRLTARRLNRAEYGRTIRDLLGVNASAAERFPLDDSGHGFDNDGDVLSISPLLMEKFQASAREVSRLAVYGAEVPARPRRLARLITRKILDPSSTEVAEGAAIVCGYSVRGTLYGTFDFPADAEYEFRLAPADLRMEPGNDDDEASRSLAELQAFRERQLAKFPPERWVFTLDDRVVKEGTVAGGYGHSYGATPEVVARVRANAGPHALRVFFPSLTDSEHPERNIPKGLRRALSADWLEISGPFKAAPRKASPERLFVCTAASDACARKIIGQLATRAYRRPGTAPELQRLLGIYRKAKRLKLPFRERIRWVVEAVLVSPAFLMRTESRAPGDWDLASRLSYFLWESMPDEQLFEAAREGRLREPGALEAQAKRMLADSKAEAFVESFSDQWLGLRELKRRTPDPDRFATVDDELLDFMLQETRLFVGALIREDRSVLDAIDAPFTYLNGPLATHYGIRGVSGYPFRRVELAGDQRGGLLGQASVLTASSQPTRTSVVKRGKWVLESLLGTPPPAPPSITPLIESEIGVIRSQRESMKKHSEDPNCASCHARMDPLGFGLENYDAAGAWRTMDGSFPIDASGSLPDGTAFSGGKELKRLLRAEEGKIRRSLAEKLLIYALGRGLEAGDLASVDRIVERMKSHANRFSSLLLGVVTSPAFQEKPK